MEITGLNPLRPVIAVRIEATDLIWKNRSCAHLRRVTDVVRVPNMNIHFK